MLKCSIQLKFFSIVFFFSSRRRHTRCLSDWSSDVCSSDLVADRRLVRHRSKAAALVTALLMAVPLAGCGDKPQVAPERPPAPVAVATAIAQEIGRASCRERVKSSVGGGTLKENSDSENRRK